MIIYFSKSINEECSILVKEHIYLFYDTVETVTKRCCPCVYAVLTPGFLNDLSIYLTVSVRAVI